MFLLLAVFAFSSPFEDLQAIKTEVQNSISDLKSIQQSLTVSAEDLQYWQTKLEALNKKLEALEQDIQKYQDSLKELQDQLQEIRNEYEQLLQDWKKYQQDLRTLKIISISSGCVAVICLVSLALILLK